MAKVALKGLGDEFSDCGGKGLEPDPEPEDCDCESRGMEEMDEAELGWFSALEWE